MELRRCFGKNVRRLRKQTGITQEAFADMVGLARSYMSGIETGQRNPTLDVVETIAAELKVPPSTLLE
jgi:transcriptional regulator with XRE-family HTH domain